MNSLKYLVSKNINGQKAISDDIQINHSDSYLIIALLVFCIFVAQFGANINNRLIQYFATILYLTIAFVYGSQYAIPIMLFSLFNTKTLVLFGVSCSSLLTLVLLVKYFLSRTNNCRSITITELIFLLVFCFYEILMFLLGRELNLLELIKFWFSMVFARLYLNANNGKKWMSECFLFLFSGYIMTVIVSVLLEPSALSEQRLSISDAGANMTGIFAGFIMAYSLLFLLDNKVKGILKAVSFISIIVSVIIGILTGSRTFVLMIAISILTILIASFFIDKGKFLRYFLIIASVILIVFLVIQNNVLLSNKVSFLIQRFVKPKHGDISNHRFEIWALYIDVLRSRMSYFLFGFDYTKAGIMNMAHNALIEQFATYGIIGNIIIISFVSCEISKMFHEIKANKDNAFTITSSNFHLIPLLAIFVSGMTSHSFMAVSKTILIIFTIFCFYLHRIRKKSYGGLK